jgi:hypothetical protein
MQTIVRFSLNRDKGSKLRNALTPILEGAGIKKVSTGTYKGDVTEAVLRNVLAQFWNAMGAHMGPAHLDHFWMYADNEDAPKRGLETDPV